jgi:hypothetical protein
MTLKTLVATVLGDQIFAWQHVSVDIVIVEIFFEAYIIFEIVKDKVYVTINSIDPIKPGINIRRFNVVEKMKKYLDKELVKVKNKKPPYNLREE